jgi:hypothetical protein
LNIHIISYCRLTNDKVEVNGREISIQKTESSWLNDIYRSLKISYPKFFKMDNLSKAGFLASELLLNEEFPEKETPKKNISIVLINGSSSLDDDRIYQETIQDKTNYFPSPSVFVYTLPNIVSGEIAIRNKIMGETSFYISETFSAKKLHDAVIHAFSDESISHVICSWTDYELNNCDVLLLLISKENQKGIPFNINNIYHLHI